MATNLTTQRTMCLRQWVKKEKWGTVSPQIHTESENLSTNSTLDTRLPIERYLQELGIFQPCHFGNKEREMYNRARNDVFSPHHHRISSYCYRPDKECPTICDEMINPRLNNNAKKKWRVRVEPKALVGIIDFIRNILFFSRKQLPVQGSYDKEDKEEFQSDVHA